MFDPNVTYWQSLRIVARGLIQWPLNRYEARQIAAAIKDAAVYSIIPFARVIALILLPFSAPLCAWLVQRDRKKTAARIGEAKAAAEQIWRQQGGGE